MSKRVLSGLCAAVLLLSAVSMSEAALFGRDLDGNVSTTEGYFDDVLGITWLADANAGAGSAFDDGASNSDGLMTWQNAVDWAGALTVGSFSDWRLPSISVAGGLPIGSASAVNVAFCVTATEIECWDNELGYMFFYNLTPAGDTPPTDFSTNLSGNQGPFQNIGILNWSGTQQTVSPPLVGRPYVADYFQGLNAIRSPTEAWSAWAVHSGDIGTPVPVPSAAILFATGLVCLIGWNYRKNNDR